VQDKIEKKYSMFLLYFSTKYFINFEIEVVCVILCFVKATRIPEKVLSCITMHNKTRSRQE